MKQRVGLAKKAITCALSALLGLSGVYVPDVAAAQGEEPVPEWAVDDGGERSELFAEAVLPTTYDMRTEGLVTPVKFQNPWGSCWAFGGTAAAETSILSAYGSTYERSKLDLSERHLTYFALQPVSEAVDPDQVGEGLHTIDPSANAAFDAGGQPVFITTLFSQGIGPMLESLYPYRGTNAVTSLDVFDQDPVKATKEMMATELGGMEAVEAFIESQVQQSGMTADEVIAPYVEKVRALYEDVPTYSKEDDWSIPETNEDGTSNRLISNGMVLRNGNVLPTYLDGNDLPSQAGMEAIKQEILNGHAVSIAFHAEQGTTYAKTPSESSKDHTQYVFDKPLMNHGVCIVGWDDNYPAENFSHEAKVTQPDGSVLDRTAETTPPGNGAWIVKNSWGSEVDATTDELGNTINKRKWGNLNDEGQATGYFYLSYYDKTIQQTESMEFEADLGSAGGAFEVLQHDYMPSNGGFYTTSATTGSDVTSSANVFEAKNGAIALKSVSTRTSEINARVTFAIYELNDNATNPTDGKLLYRISRNFEYGGFHRLNIDQPITIGAGKRFSVVSTTSTVDQNGARIYSATANQGASEELVKVGTGGRGKCYSSAVINEGESYLYKDGSWQDWRDYTEALPVDESLKELGLSAEKYVDISPIDNFSIKVYAVAAKESEPEPEPGVIALVGSGHVQSIGDKPAEKVGDGIIIGTTGESKRLEAVTIGLPEGTDGSIEYRAHVQRKGWGGWVAGGKCCGTTGQASRLEAVQMRLTGALAETHSVWYRMHSQTWGWLGWAKDGQAAGTAGQAKRGEAVEVQILPNGKVPVGYVEGQASYVGAITADVHLQGIGWTGAGSALTFGAAGQGRRIEAIRLSAPNQPEAGGVTYEAHAQSIGWMGKVADGVIAGTTGQSRRLEALRVRLTGDMGEKYSVWYRVQSQDQGWLGWACDGADAGTSGLSKRAEAIEVQILPQGQFPNDYDASKVACMTA